MNHTIIVYMVLKLKMVCIRVRVRVKIITVSTVIVVGYSYARGEERSLYSLLLLHYDKKNVPPCTWSPYAHDNGSVVHHT